MLCSGWLLLSPYLSMWKYNTCIPARRSWGILSHKFPCLKQKEEAISSLDPSLITNYSISFITYKHEQCIFGNKRDNKQANKYNGKLFCICQLLPPISHLLMKWQCPTEGLLKYTCSANPGNSGNGTSSRIQMLKALLGFELVIKVLDGKNNMELKTLSECKQSPFYCL